MAQLIEHNGKYYKGSPGQWEEINWFEFDQESQTQQRVQDMSTFDQLRTGQAYYTQKLLSGARELTYGDPAEEQQRRAQLEQDYQPMRDYGGFASTAGEFTGAASTAVIPGGLKTQIGIGAAQGAAENPDSPFYSALLGAGMTWAGDMVADSLGRISRTLTRKRAAVDPDYAAKIARGKEQGLKFRPDQEFDDQASRVMVNQLRKNPRFAQLDLDRFLSNQAALNSAAARSIGAEPTGRITDVMRGKAIDKVRKAFNDIAEESAPITILGEPYQRAFDEFTQTGQELNERFMNRFPNLFEGRPVSGKEFNDARNWLAKQLRLPANWASGAAEEMQGVMAVLDDSLLQANATANPGLVENILDARRIYKANLVIEGSLRSAEAAASGNLSAPIAYNVLKKYDKGGIFRGRFRADPFNQIVDAMSAAGDAKPPVMPSLDAGRGMFGTIQDVMWNNPAAASAIRGENLGRAMLGQFDEIAPNAARRAAGIGTARGLMATQEEEALP